MKKTRTGVLVTLAAVALGGCGTIRNLATGDPEIYGGVQKDVEIIETPRKVQGVGVNPSTLAFLVPADLCLSLVADTLTLPLAICMRQNDHAGDDKVAGDGGGNPVNPSGPDKGGKPPDTAPVAAPQSP